MVNYEYYRIFYYVAKCLNMTRAAEMIGSSQPNVTRSMNNLEAQLGCKLFERTHHGISLTPDGKMLYDHVSIAVDQLQMAEEYISAEKDLDTGQIRIGVTEIAMNVFLLDQLKLFQTKYPRIVVHLYNYTSPKAAEALVRGLVDFAVITTPVNLPETLHVEYLDTFSEILVGGPKYKSLSAKKHSLRELHRYPFISLSVGTGSREFLIQHFLNQGQTFDPAVEAATTGQIQSMVRFDLGLGFVPASYITERGLIREQIYEIPLEDPLPPRKICLVTRDGESNQRQAPLTFVRQLHAAARIGQAGRE